MGAHALIIDDDMNNLSILGQYLTFEGITFDAVQDPRHIDSMIASMSSVNLIFLDLELPHIDGFQLIDRLRAVLGASVPIVAYTVHLDASDEAQAKGFNGFVSKPLDANRFPSQLQRILNGEVVWDPR